MRSEAVLIPTPARQNVHEFVFRGLLPACSDMRNLRIVLRS